MRQGSGSKKSSLKSSGRKEREKPEIKETTKSRRGPGESSWPGGVPVTVWLERVRAITFGPRESAIEEDEEGNKEGEAERG